MIFVRNGIADAVRGHPSRYIVLEGHVAADRDLVISRHQGVVVIEAQRSFLAAANAKKALNRLTGPPSSD